MILVVSTDSFNCRFYEYHKHTGKLIFLKEFNHPQDNMKTSELTADKLGNYQGHHSGGSAYSPHMEMKEVHVQAFLRKLADELNTEIALHDVKLIVVASSQVSGVLFKYLNKQVKAAIINHLQKDLLHLSEHELTAYLQEHAQFPDS